MPTRRSSAQGVTLIELVVFIAVVSIALIAMIKAMNFSLIKSVDPIVQIRALECAQAKLDEISARKFDANSPTGGVPACGSAEAGAAECAGISPDPSLDDVGDFNGHTDNSNPHCSISVSVVEAGTDLGLPNDQARLVTVSVSANGGGQASLSAYRTNF